MSAQINENTQYTDPTTGELLSNGFVYIGENNLDAKLNPKAIYADRELTTALLNPQRTGSDGRVENKIWIDGKYSLKVENFENVQKLNDLSLGELAATNNTTLTNVQGTDSLTAEGNPAVTALVNNQVYILTAAGTNTTAMTLTIDLTPTWPIKKHHDLDMAAGDTEADQTLALIWNETDSVFELMTNSAIAPVDVATTQTVTGDKTFSGTTVLSGPTTLAGATTISGVATTSNLVNLAAGANIASATTIDLTAATGNGPRITGTTATSAVTMNTGQQVLVVADGVWPLTYNATTNKLNSGASYTCAAGDMILYSKDLSGIIHGNIIKADGKAVVGTAPTAAQGSSLVWLATGTASASSSLDFTGIDSTYSSYEFRFSAVRPATDAVILHMLVSTDGGSTFKTGASDYSYITEGSDTAAASVATTITNAAEMRLCGNIQGIGNAATEGADGQLTLNNPSSTTQFRRCYGFFANSSPSGATAKVTFAGDYKIAGTAVDAVRFIMSSGNITSGSIRMYGIKDA